MTLAIEFVKPLVEFIEPDASAAETVERALDAVGYRSRRYAEAEELLESREGGGRAFLSEMRLPRCGGLELLRRVRAFDQTTPFLFLSDLVEPSLVVSAMKMGAQDYLRKPASHRQLFDAIDLAMRAVTNANSGPALAAADETTTMPSPGCVPWPTAGCDEATDAPRCLPMPNAACPAGFAATTPPEDGRPVKAVRRGDAYRRPPLPSPFLPARATTTVQQRETRRAQDETLLAHLDGTTRDAVQRLRRLDPDAPLEHHLESVERQGREGPARSGLFPTWRSITGFADPAWR